MSNCKARAGGVEIGAIDEEGDFLLWIKKHRCLLHERNKNANNMRWANIPGHLPVAAGRRQAASRAMILIGLGAQPAEPCRRPRRRRSRRRWTR